MRILLSLAGSLAISLSAIQGASAQEFNTEAKQAILIDYITDTVLFEKSANEQMFPSSMTKILTMYVVFDALKKGTITMDTEFTVSEKAWKTGGSQMFLKVGDRVKVSDLVQGVIVQSGNDACITLAEGVSGSVEAFVDEMNNTAHKIGAKGTLFENPDGLPATNHHSTARDLATISKRLISDFPEYYHFYSQKEYTYAGITQHNRNKLLLKPDLGVDGIKTGYTEMGGYGIVVSGTNSGRRYIAVVNGLETEKKRLIAAEELLKYAYANFRSMPLFKKFDLIGKVRIWGGIKNSVNVATAEDIEVLVNRKDANIGNYKAEIAMKEPWIAPIKKGTHMANLVIKSGDKTVSIHKLYATDDVAEASFSKKLTQKLKLLLGME